MSASKKAAKKSAAKSAAKPAAPKAKTKAKPAAAKKTVAAGTAKKSAAKVKPAPAAKPAPAKKAIAGKKTTAPSKKAAPAKTVATKKTTVKATKPQPKSASPAVKAKPTAAAKAKPASILKPAAKKPATKSKPTATKTSQPTAGKAKAAATTSKSAQSAKAPASAPQKKASTASRSSAQAGPASKKAKQTFVKQSSSSKQNTPAPELDAKTKELVLSARKRTVSNVGPKANRAGKGPLIAFTMDDVAQALAKKQSESADEASSAEKTTPTRVVKKQEVDIDIPQEKRSHSAVSLSDILGFNPAEKKTATATSKGREVPRKWSRYYKLLVDLRERVSNVLEQHTAETLKRSTRDDSGDLSGYGQHMADAGTDTFDRDFALSMVSSEQEALFEINEAIERIYNGTYGVCEITGEPISAERLEAVPFTRYSLEGQKELEKNKRQKIQRGGVFSDSDENIPFDEDDN